MTIAALRHYRPDLAPPLTPPSFTLVQISRGRRPERAAGAAPPSLGAARAP